MQTWPELRHGCVRLETDALLVLDKPAGWSVMGERHDTDLVRLARDAGETMWPAHRIDKVTSGLVLFAKTLAAHGDLTRQFARRTVAKDYLALATGVDLPARGTVELPLAIGRKNRVRIAAPREAIVRADVDDVATFSVPDDAVLPGESYPSTTTFERLWVGDDSTLLAVQPTTGRRHQIRVHLAWIGHALVGDPLFTQGGARTGLHAWRLAFDGPGGVRHDVEAPPGEDFLALAPGVAAALAGP